MKLKCIITDDEPLSAEGLSKYLEVIDYVELVAVAAVVPPHYWVYAAHSDEACLAAYSLGEF